MLQFIAVRTWNPTSGEWWQYFMDCPSFCRCPFIYEVKYFTVDNTRPSSVFRVSVKLHVLLLSIMRSPMSHIKGLLLCLSLLCSQWNRTLVDLCTLLVPTRAMSWCTIWGLACCTPDGQFKLSTVSLRLSRSTTWIHGFGCDWLSVASWHIKRLVTRLIISDFHTVCDCAQIHAACQMELSSSGF